MIEQDAERQFEGHVLDGGRCLCAFCGKQGKLGGLFNPIPPDEDQPPKILCLDCMMEGIAQRDGISKQEALRRRKKMFGAFYAFQGVMFERYLKETKQDHFSSIEEANTVLEFVKGVWNKLPKTFHDLSEHMDLQDLKEVCQELEFDFRSFRSMVRDRLEEKIGRNNPCPCGSGKKYKRCCLGGSKRTGTEEAML